MSSLGTAQPRYQQTVLSPLARRLGFECAWVGDTLRAIGWGESQVIQTDTAIATAGINPVYAPGGLVGKSFSGFGFGQLLLRCTDTTANTFIVVYAGLGAGSSDLGRLASTFNGSGGHDIYYDGGGLELQGFYSGGTTVRTISPVGTGSTPVCLAWSTDGTSSPTSLASVDGAAVTVTAAANSSGSRFAGGTQIGIGGRPDTTGRQSASQIFFVARSRFALDAVTLDRLTKGRAPWSLLLQPSAPRRIWAPVSAGGGSVEVGLATETDTAQPIASSQRAALGLAAETDAAQAIALTQRAALGIATETDTAQPLTSHQARALGLASETDTAQAISSGAVAAIGLATETDSAQALASQQSLAIGQASETDTAQPLDVVAGGFLGIALEQDIAQPLTAAQRLAIGQAQESDTALALLAGQGKAIGLALEADTALPVQGLLGLGLAQEQDTALPLIAPPPPPPPPATESETTAGYRRNPRTPRDVDPLPAEDLADQVRDKWDAIERANEAVRRARRGQPPTTTPTRAPAPNAAQALRKRGASAAQLAAIAGGLGADASLTPEQLADEEAFILLVAELV